MVTWNVRLELNSKNYGSELQFAHTTITEPYELLIAFNAIIVPTSTKRREIHSPFNNTKKHVAAL